MASARGRAGHERPRMPGGGGPKEPSNPNAGNPSPTVLDVQRVWGWGLPSGGGERRQARSSGRSGLCRRLSAPRPDAVGRSRAALVRHGLFRHVRGGPRWWRPRARAGACDAYDAGRCWDSLALGFALALVTGMSGRVGGKGRMSWRGPAVQSNRWWPKADEPGSAATICGGL